MSITVSDVTTLLPVDLSILSGTLIQGYIDIVTTEADLQLNNIFVSPLSTVTEADCQNYGTQNTFGSSFISIGAWQKTGLTLKKTTKDKSEITSLSETPLTLGSDYNLWYGFKGKKIPSINLPVTGIQLSYKLGLNEILRVYGTYGWQAGYPSDVKQALVNVIISLAGYANSTAQFGGINGMTRVKDMTTEVEIDAGMAEQLRTQARSFLNDPVFQEIITKYNLVTEETISVI